MPAAAVIPAPIAYIKVVAVKKLVVGVRVWLVGPPTACTGWLSLPLGTPVLPLTGVLGGPGLLL